MRFSLHNHIETVFSGSTLESFVEKHVELKRTHFVYTDYSYFTSALKAYDLCAKKGLKPIIGVEVFFFDPNCDIIRGRPAAKAKYFKTTLYAPTPQAYQELGVLTSTAPKTILLNEDEHPLWDWSWLEKAAQAGCIVGSSDVNDIVGKNILLNDEGAAERTFLKLKDMFKDNMITTIIGVNQNKRYQAFVDVVLANGDKIFIQANERVATNAGKNVKAVELFESQNRHFKLITSYANKIQKNHTGDNTVVSVKLKRGYIPFRDGDIQLKVNKGMVALAKKHGVNFLYSDYAFYADMDDKAVQDVKLSQDGKKEYAKRHIQNSTEASIYLSSVGLNELEIDDLFERQDAFGARFNDFKLKFDYRLPKPDRDPMQIVAETIKSIGRLPSNNPEYVTRLRYELDVLAKNGKIDLLPYFIPLLELNQYVKDKGTLTGPSRGSAGGSLLCYLLGITQVDPIKYGLSFERFLSLDRVMTGAFPDIDLDYSSRDHVVGLDGRSGYLFTKYGDKAAQISTKSLLRLKSSIKDVNRYMNGSVEPYIEQLTKALPAAPQGVSDADFVFGYEDKDNDGVHVPGLLELNADLKNYTLYKPKEWDIVQKCLGIARSSSLHASAFLISDRPIAMDAPLFRNGSTQFEAKYCEKVGLIKYDFLVVKQLKDIEDCLTRINKRNGDVFPIGDFTHKGVKTNIWDLPEDLSVYESVWGGETETIFQISTGAMIPFVRDIKPRSVDDLSTILALVRPGPLDFVDEKTGRNMAKEYVERRYGRSTPDIPELGALLPETYGILVFQEQVQKISKEIGDLPGNEAENLRRAMSKKLKTEVGKYKSLFMEGAVKHVAKEVAEKIWGQMETSSRYSFNKSHSVGYAMITYACMFLKHHYPLEWWASVISNASEEEITSKLYKHVSSIVTPPDINISTEQMEIDYNVGKIRSKLTVLRGLGEKAAEKLIQNRPYTDIKDFVKKDIAGPSLARRLIHVGVLDSLFPKDANMFSKMQTYEDTVELVKYEEKISQGKKATLKKGAVDPEFMIGVHPIKDFCIKKSILPTLPLNLSSLILAYPPRMQEGDATRDKSMFSDSRGVPVKFITGENLKILDSMEHTREFKYCFSAYIIKMEEKSYAKNTRKRLILTVDIDGEISERILWPDYNSGQLSYPAGVQKQTVALFFYKTRVNKQASMYEIVPLKAHYDP